MKLRIAHALSALILCSECRLASIASLCIILSGTDISLYPFIAKPARAAAQAQLPACERETQGSTQSRTYTVHIGRVHVQVVFRGVDIGIMLAMVMTAVLPGKEPLYVSFTSFEGGHCISYTGPLAIYVLAF